MDAFEYLKTVKRLCLKYERKRCGCCPLADEEGNCEAYLNAIVEMDEDRLANLADFVENWAKNNPIRTRKTEFLKLFPNAALDEDGYPNSCIRFFCEDARCNTNCKDCHKFWDEEI